MHTLSCNRKEKLSCPDIADNLTEGFTGDGGSRVDAGIDNQLRILLSCDVVGNFCRNDAVKHTLKIVERTRVKSVRHTDIHFAETCHINFCSRQPCCAVAEHTADGSVFTDDFGKLRSADAVLHTDNKRIFLQTGENVFCRLCHAGIFGGDEADVKLRFADFLN